MELPGGESEVKFLERNLTAQTEDAAADPRGLGAPYAAGGYGAAAGYRNGGGRGRGRGRGRASYR